MIDNPEHAARLLARINAALPLAARLVEDTQATTSSAAECSIIAVSYAGEEGGIMCQLPNSGGRSIQISLAHLRCDPRHPLTREIVLYQKRRAKRIRRGASPGQS